jgi:2-polyprenyl-3-methyl-5-hydroxy-6-metoxy-1,4-benzoquinol methylase
MLPHIERTLPPGASVLDVGAGSGRDVEAMIAAGFDAYGVGRNSRLIDQRDADGRRFHDHEVDPVRDHLATLGLR